jgi:hypothetical protein
MWFNGLLDLSVTQLILVTLGMTHVTIVSVTLYLHRHSAHNALDLHPVLQHVFRFWLWLTTAQNTKAWTAIHRKHHAKCETGEDPHSPVVLGLRTVLLEGAELYARAATPETLERYGQRTPDDWIERRLYTPYKSLGIVLMAVIDLLLFGVNGIWIWAIQMLWISGLPQFRMPGQCPQHPALGHSRGRRGAAQQPSHLSQLGKAVPALVRGGHRLGLHSSVPAVWPSPAQGRPADCPPDSGQAGAGHRHGDGHRQQPF